MNRLTLLIIAFVGLIVLSCNQLSDQAEDSRILIVHSYHLEYAWTGSIHEGIMETLEGKGFQIESYFMDTKRNTSQEAKTTAGNKALELIESFKPDVVITSDDNAQAFFAQQLAGKDDISVVFCGVNAAPEKYGFDSAPNVTGILERPNIRTSLSMMQKILPNIQSYTIITDDSPTSAGFLAYVESLELPPIQQIIKTNDFGDWKAQFLAIQSDAIITYMYHTIKDGGQNVEPADVLSWTMENLQKPSLGFFDFAIEGGVMFGNVESGYEHGKLAAKRAIKILHGKKANELPITSASKGLLLVNEKTASRLGIDVGPVKNIANYIFN